jgi:hypothetical protein
MLYSHSPTKINASAGSFVTKLPMVLSFWRKWIFSGCHFSPIPKAAGEAVACARLQTNAFRERPADVRA